MKRKFLIGLFAVFLFPAGLLFAASSDSLIGLGMPPELAGWISSNLISVNSSGNIVLPVASGKKLSVTIAGTENSSVSSVGLTTTGNLVASSATGGLTLALGTLAAAGSAQGDAAAIAGRTTTVTASDGTKGVILPASPGVGDVYKVINTVAAVLKIYPGTGDTINATAANTAVSVAASTVTDCIAVSTAAWWCSEGVAP